MALGVGQSVVWMSLVYLSLAIAALWINLLGAGLAAWVFIKDYAVARITGLLALGLVCFFIEHFWGWGPHPVLLPFTTIISFMLIWRHRRVLRENRGLEALFAAGFFYCFAWRYTFPDINFTGEKMPNLAMIEAYMRGVRLPPPDVWLPPFTLNFYYSFQHYGASFLGRLLDLGPGPSYHLAYCSLVGYITLLAGSCVSRLCPWTPGRWAGMLALLIGGSGAVVAAHIIMHHAYMMDSVRFVSGAINHGNTNNLGKQVAEWMAKPGVDPRDLPMEPLSYVVVNGDYHPPLMAFLLLAFATTLIAAQATGATGGARWTNNLLLTATLPIALISNAWVLPLQFILVGGWILFRALAGDRGYLVPALVGVAATAILEYPYLIEFTRQSIGDNASLGITASQDHTPLLGWLMTFWPVVGIMILALFNRERRPLVFFLVGIWAVELAFTELFYNHDVYGGVWIRFNTTLKWWSWVYAGILLTLGAINLGSKSAVCRYGTLLMVLPTLIFARDMGVDFNRQKKDSFGKLEGYYWLKDDVIRDLVTVLRSRPDGIALESGPIMANSESQAVTLFANKMSYVGWPWHETTWRGALSEIHERMSENDAFYTGKLQDPLGWLLHNNIRYVIWLPRDNMYANAHFAPIFEQIKSRYYWHHLFGDNPKFQLGFWERIDEVTPH